MEANADSLKMRQLIRFGLQMFLNYVLKEWGVLHDCYFAKVRSDGDESIFPSPKIQMVL